MFMKFHCDTWKLNLVHILKSKMASNNKMATILSKIVWSMNMYYTRL